MTTVVYKKKVSILTTILITFPQNADEILTTFSPALPQREGRSQSYQNTASSGLTPADKSVKERHAKEQEQNKEKIKLWIKEQAQKLYDAYFSDNAVGKSHPALNVLHRLTEASEKLNIEVNYCLSREIIF